MKSLVLIVAAVGLALAQEPVLLHYHENVGTAEAARIKQAENALDFDGSRIVGGAPAVLGAYPFLVNIIWCDRFIKHLHYVINYSLGRRLGC